jgi:hypothetical protein
VMVPATGYAVVRILADNPGNEVIDKSSFS